MKIHCRSPGRLVREWVNDSGVMCATVLVSSQNRDLSAEKGNGVGVPVASNGFDIFMPSVRSVMSS